VRELNRLIARGMLKRVKIGRRTFVSFTQIQGLIEELKATA
jgi:hypothetical protein